MSSDIASYDVRVSSFEALDARTAYLLWQLRESVFVVEQQCPYPELDGRDLEPGTRHVWAASDGGPIGYLRILDEGPRARIGRVLVVRSHRGCGVSNALMSTALEIIGDRPSVLNAQSRLAGWYASFGFEQSGDEFLEDGIAHIPMRHG